MTLPPGFTAYLDARRELRMKRVAQKWEAMTRRERRLVREAAVMGYVRGVQAGLGHPVSQPPTIPHDRDLVIEVLDACDAFPDLYPVINHLRP